MLTLLVDCNNFFVSCERVFRPDLEHTPIIVLSNNDGCAIARSNEAKDLGIGMGDPVFKIRNIIKAHNIHVFSSNFALYADISSRIIDTLKTFDQNLHVYSIDEAFLTINSNKDATTMGANIKHTIRQNIGVPVSVGIAPSKTLAKIANDIAKRRERTALKINDPHHAHYGVVEITDKNRTKLLHEFPIEDIWNIGHQLTKLLKSHGIHTALDLATANKEWIRTKMGVLGERTLLELNGVSCWQLRDEHKRNKTIITSRSFKKGRTEKHELEYAIARFTTIAAKRLRAQNALCSILTVSASTNRFYKYYLRKTTTKTLPYPTAHTPTLIATAKQALNEMFIPNNEYKKAGILLSGIIPDHTIQRNLFEPNKIYTKKQQRLMSATDTIAQKYGRDALRPAAIGPVPKTTDTRSFHSPRYTTSWEELLRVKVV